MNAVQTMRPIITWWESYSYINFHSLSPPPFIVWGEILTETNLGDWILSAAWLINARKKHIAFGTVDSQSILCLCWKQKKKRHSWDKARSVWFNISPFQKMDRQSFFKTSYVTPDIVTVPSTENASFSIPLENEREIQYQPSSRRLQLLRLKGWDNFTGSPDLPPHHAWYFPFINRCLDWSQSDTRYFPYWGISPLQFLLAMAIGPDKKAFLL